MQQKDCIAVENNNVLQEHLLSDKCQKEQDKVCAFDQNIKNKQIQKKVEKSYLF